MRLFLFGLVFLLQTSLIIMFIHHVLSGLLMGTIFMGVGDNANRPFDNFKFVVSVVVFFMYTHLMVPILLCKSVYSTIGNLILTIFKKKSPAQSGTTKLQIK